MTSYHETNGVRTITTYSIGENGRQKEKKMIEESDENRKIREDLENELILQQESELKAKMEIEEKRLFNQMQERQEILWQRYIARETEKEKTETRVIKDDDYNLDPNQKILQIMCKKIAIIRSLIPRQDYSKSLDALDDLYKELEGQKIPDITKSILSADILFQKALITKRQICSTPNFQEKQKFYLKAGELFDEAFAKSNSANQNIIESDNSPENLSVSSLLQQSAILHSKYLMDKDIKKLFDNIEKRLQEANSHREKVKEAMEIKGKIWYGRLISLGKGLSEKAQENQELEDAVQSLRDIVNNLDDTDKEGLKSLLTSVNEHGHTSDRSSFILDSLRRECPIFCVNLIFSKFCLNNFIKN